MFIECCCQAAGNNRFFVLHEGDERDGVPAHISYDPLVKNVAILGDLQGDWDDFCACVDRSQGLSFQFDDVEHYERRCAEDLMLWLAEGWHFVFQGDAFDKGSGTLRILEALVRLKRSCRERVHLLLGNRDLDMMGWTSELTPSGFEKLEDIPVMSEEMLAGAAFEARREELALLADVELEAVTDAAVVESYEGSLKPGGWMREFLFSAQIGVLLGETLFVRGLAISVDSLGNSSSDAEDPSGKAAEQQDFDKDAAAQKLHDWLISINTWASTQIRDSETSLEWESSGLGSEGLQRARRGACLPPGKWAHGYDSHRPQRLSSNGYVAFV